MRIQINSIDFRGSLVNGPGIRTLLFIQGCDKRCEGCHNTSTWDVNRGAWYDVSELSNIIREGCHNKKLTIAGGEPFFQYEALLELVRSLSDFDLCIYTGSNLDEVPKEIIPFLKYIKVGRYDKSKRCTTIPYIGSTNQRFISLRDNDEQ